MLYNLKNGRTIELTLEEFLYLTDDELNYLEGMDIGDHIEDPFHLSPITKEAKPLPEVSEITLDKMPASLKLSDGEILLDN
jgi:hypothetical protein